MKKILTILVLLSFILPVGAQQQVEKCTYVREWTMNPNTRISGFTIVVKCAPVLLFT